MVPSGCAWSTTTLVPAPAASILVVALFGTGPGLYFDFATLSFQTPTCGSPCANAAPIMNKDNPTHATDATREGMVGLMCLLLQGLPELLKTRPETTRPR